MAEFPNDQARASYLAGLRDERGGLNAQLTAARGAKNTALVSTIAARVTAVDDEIDRVTGIDNDQAAPTADAPPTGDTKSAAAKKDGGA